MTFQIWRLTEGGEDNLGLACTANGLILGRTPLIEPRDQQFVVRERDEIERLLHRAYETGPPIDRIMPGLATVARALNANDQCLARIAAVHLRLPDLRNSLTRSDMEAEDRLIKYARDESGETDWDPAKHPRTGTPPNPGWFAPTDGESEASSTQTAANDNPAQRSDASPAGGDNWVRLPPGPKRIDELADFVEWMANAKPEDEQTIRTEIKRYFHDVGDQGSAAALNSALTVLLRPDLTLQDRQTILDHLDVFTRADPAEYAHNRDWTTGAAIAAGTIASGGASEGTPDETASGEAATEIAAPGQGVPVQAAADTSSGVWKYGWGRRGNEIHRTFSDGSLPPMFRTIDNFTDGIATSFKSIDLNAATYQASSQLTYRINVYVSKLGDYEGGALSNTKITLSEIQDRVLNLIVPKGSLTKEQYAAIEAAKRRALTANKYPVKIVVTQY